MCFGLSLCFLLLEKISGLVGKWDIYELLLSHLNYLLMDFVPELTFGTEFNLTSRENIGLEDEENIFRQVIL